MLVARHRLVQQGVPHTRSPVPGTCQRLARIHLHPQYIEAKHSGAGTLRNVATASSWVYHPAHGSPPSPPPRQPGRPHQDPGGNGDGFRSSLGIYAALVLAGVGSFILCTIASMLFDPEPMHTMKEPETFGEALGNAIEVVILAIFFSPIWMIVKMFEMILWAITCPIWLPLLATHWTFYWPYMLFEVMPVVPEVSTMVGDMFAWTSGPPVPKEPLGGWLSFVQKIQKVLDKAKMILPGPVLGAGFGFSACAGSECHDGFTALTASLTGWWCGGLSAALHHSCNGYSLKKRSNAAAMTGFDKNTPKSVTSSSKSTSATSISLTAALEELASKDAGTRPTSSMLLPGSTPIPPALHNPAPTPVIPPTTPTPTRLTTSTTTRSTNTAVSTEANDLTVTTASTGSRPSIVTNLLSNPITSIPMLVLMPWTVAFWPTKTDKSPSATAAKGSDNGQKQTVKRNLMQQWLKDYTWSTTLLGTVLCAAAGTSGYFSSRRPAGSNRGNSGQHDMEAAAFFGGLALGSLVVHWSL